MIKGVYLVGGSLGDQDLITIKGLEILKKADVIVYDCLVNLKLLDYAEKQCQKIYVGKKSGVHTMEQSKINNLLICLAKKNEIVVRLKGGDPYVFGRGGEEGIALYNAGISFEVIPGVTSAIGGLAYAGIPITLRNAASSFHVITGHTAFDDKKIKYEHLAKIDGTLVFLMGMKNLQNIVNKLIENGKNIKTPVAIIQRASTPEQKVVIGTLDTIVKTTLENSIKSPSLIVIGDVVNYRKKLNFFEKKPMFSQHILATGSKKTCSKISYKLTAIGGKVTEMPTVKIKRKKENNLKENIENIHRYSGIIFTSRIAVSIFFETMNMLNLDARHLHGQKIFVIGKETKNILTTYGIISDYIPNVYTKEALESLIKSNHRDNDCYLMPRSARGNKEWLIKLKKNYNVNEIQCYNTINIETLDIDINAIYHVNYITFTSSSAVEGYINLAKKYGKLRTIMENAKIVAIGPATAKCLKNNDINVDIMPKCYTILDMLEAIAIDVSNLKESSYE